MNLNYYEILNLDYYANGKEIAESYLWQFNEAMARVDKYKNSPAEEFIKAYKTRMQAIDRLNDAYKVLSSIEERIEYNKTISLQDQKSITRNHFIYSNALLMFAKLNNNLGEEVDVELVGDEEKQVRLSGRLLSVDMFNSIYTDDGMIPFLDTKWAIKRIVNKKTKETIYENIYINHPYIGTDLNKIKEIVTKSWGKIEAVKQMQEHPRFNQFMDQKVIIKDGKPYSYFVK